MDWGAKWPREAFTLEEPIWYAEPNYDEVARVARAWVATKRKKLAAAAAGGGAAAGEVRALRAAWSVRAREGDEADARVAAAARAERGRAARGGRRGGGAGGRRRRGGAGSERVAGALPRLLRA